MGCLKLAYGSEADIPMLYRDNSETRQSVVSNIDTGLSIAYRNPTFFKEVGEAKTGSQKKNGIHYYPFGMQMPNRNWAPSPPDCEEIEQESDEIILEQHYEDIVGVDMSSSGWTNLTGIGSIGFVTDGNGEMKVSYDVIDPDGSIGGILLNTVVGDDYRLQLDLDVSSLPVDHYLLCVKFYFDANGDFHIYDPVPVTSSMSIDLTFEDVVHTQMGLAFGLEHNIDPSSVIAGSYVLVDNVIVTRHYTETITDCSAQQQFLANNNDSYRFGFNGMEKDSEVSGEGNAYTTHFRGYDPRLGRWKSLDPVVYPWQSHYAAFNNNPVYFMDPSGAEGTHKRNDKGESTWSGDVVDNEGNYHVVEMYTDAQMKAAGYTTVTMELESGQDGYSMFNDPYLDIRHRAYDKTPSMQDKRSQSPDSYWKFTLTSGNPVYYSDEEVFAHAFYHDEQMKNDLLNQKYGLENQKAYMQFSMYEAGRPLAEALLTYMLLPISEIALVEVLGNGGRVVYNVSRLHDAVNATKGVKQSNIALGLGDDLFNFAGKKGYLTYRDFSTGIQLDKIEAAITNSDNMLHFNLTGFSKIQYSKFDPSGPIGYRNITNWELHKIYNTPGALDRTTFYRLIDGVYEVVGKPF